MAAAQGNRYAARAKRWSSALERALARFAEGNTDHGLDKLADVVVKAAVEGDQTAWKEIGERIEGKVKQVIDHGITDDPENLAHQLVSESELLRSKIRNRE